MYQLINQSDTEMIKIISSSDFFHHKTNNIDLHMKHGTNLSLLRNRAAKFDESSPNVAIIFESELVTNYSSYWSWGNDFRDGLWIGGEGREEGGGLKRVKGQPLKCWCTNDGPSTAAPCANLTEGITSLVNGCPSYGSRVTTVPPPLRSYDAPERSMDFQNLS